MEWKAKIDMTWLSTKKAIGMIENLKESAYNLNTNIGRSFY